MSTSAIAIFGGTVGAMGTVIVILTSTLVIVIAALVRSKRALRMERNLLQTKTPKEPAIYEEIVLDSRKSSSPSIDTGENTAYMSVFACQRSVK